ncbi:MAG: hypothetical protein IJD46_03715 [Bacilli bacterium]|nr:hypothetical protein [Bacilli bacterium]
MKSKILMILLLIFMVIPIFACSEIVNPDDENIIDPEKKPDNPDKDPDNQGGPDKDPDLDGTEFVVSLVYNKKIYIPKNGEEIYVIWRDDYAQYKQKIDSDGYAKINLDGEFNVYLDKSPEGYTYNPNIYVVDNETPTVEIELLKISRISKGSGKDKYNCYGISTTGTYRSIIKENATVFYEYRPEEAGVYIIESMVNIFEDNVNPKIDIYEGSFAYKNKSDTIDDGGEYKKGGFTKNFKWIVYVSDQRIGNVYTFAIHLESKSKVYPINVDFSITYKDEWYEDGIISKLIEAKEAEYAVTEEYSKSEYIFVNSDGGTGSYYNSVTNGTGLLDATNFKYNEETKVWHYYDKQTETFGPKLCAYITAPCAYYEESLNMIESHGNKNLTVSNSTENYKQFIEITYAACCNSDGVCYVTMELMEFLQKFSVSQRLFFDGNGFVESTGVYAIEEDQWLFACGYYVKIN